MAHAASGGRPWLRYGDATTIHQGRNSKCASHAAAFNGERMPRHTPHALRANKALVEAASDAARNPTVLKAGVGIDDDAISLWLHWGFDVNGRLDLGRVGGSNRGLKSLAAEYLGLNLEKSKSLALSDWELRPLSEAQ
eukprot:CAMPEP_0119310844 /NCGR_PEP_ID=MMETSP1333-20130426/20489_1 /TAXON_ID=418940 /ORGANISM="Scyphosphaera apsteinii, Strain RCC1455" /LENGTH=137 /DNA_ID=CAMNT_0007315097 /DNA_START=339 /DNA_END=750 /DNA_ORIENTATION=+